MLKFCTFILRKNQLKPYYHQYLFIILLFSPLAVVRAQDGSSSSSPNPFHTLGIVLLAVLAFSGYIVLYLFFKHCVMPWASRRVERLAHAGLDSSVLKTLPVFAYSNMAGFLPNKGPVECSVCLGLFEEDERLRLLPKCGHVFHVDCVDPWLAGHSTCPLCRADLVPKPEEVTEVDSGCVTVDLEGGEEEVNVGANDVVEVVRGEIQLMQGGQYGKIWRWNSTGHVARCEGVSEEQRSTVRESNIGSRELDRSKSCIIIKLD